MQQLETALLEGIAYDPPTVQATTSAGFLAGCSCGKPNSFDVFIAISYICSS
jgi:hypothetical protein